MKNPLLLMITSVIFLLSAGCVFPFGYDPRSYSYVLRENGSNPDAITRWTLSRVHDDAIRDGSDALLDIQHESALHRPMDKRARRSLEGLRKIHDKLIQGWPGYTGLNKSEADAGLAPLTGFDRRRQIETLIENLYLDLAYDFSLFATPLSVRLFLQLRPDPLRQPERFERWVRVGQLSKLYPILDRDGNPLPRWTEGEGQFVPADLADRNGSALQRRKGDTHQLK